jgi:hypothetical protein
MWKSKPAEKASQLSFYTPDLIVSALKRSSVICEPPIYKATDFTKSSDTVGEWTLLVSPFGIFWAAYTLLGGAPHGVIFFSAKSGERISDIDTLNNIGTLESVLCDYDVTVGMDISYENKSTAESTPPNVVEVQTGDSWNDYRPARPQDFIGRDDTQKNILSFLENARTTKDSTRIFAITGNSGLGKSSLVAKVRDRTKNKHYKNKIFTFAIDMRGARSPAYISASLIKCLEQAQKAGFGDKIDIQLTNPSTPLSSSSVSEYLESVRKEGKFVCLIFDQFEELYSKPELFSVFGAAKDLMLDVASFKGAIGLGFAWKTDSTTQQDHPAYHIWHELSDHRREFKLSSFNKGEIAKAITAFEKQADFKLTAEIRHQISHSCQGFPWLLKKLCIHLYNNQSQQSGQNSTLLELDVRNLFKSDLQILSAAETSSLKQIAEKAPADWSEIIEISGVATVNNLVAKRLIIRSGDRLNVYWDIFRDYLLSGNVPVVPFNYIPSSDINAMLKVGEVLNRESFQSSECIAKKTNLKDRTVWNIGADLVLFGVAERQGTSFKLHRDMADGAVRSVLSRIRKKVDKHSLKIELYRNHAGQTVSKSEITNELKACLPGETFTDKTWGIYTNRFSNILVMAGFLVRSGSRYTIQDSGSVLSKVSTRSRSSEVFSPNASPARVCDAFELLRNNANIDNANEAGYRNSIYVLRRFNLVELEGPIAKINTEALGKFGGFREAVWSSAKNEVAIIKSIEALRKKGDISGLELGTFISKEFGLNWQGTSKTRTGNALRKWANWIIEGIEQDQIPEPPGRKKRSVPAG